MQNLNELARTITELEGEKKNVSVAQVKEILSKTFRLLASYPDAEVLKIVNRYRKKYGQKV